LPVFQLMYGPVQGMDVADRSAHGFSIGHPHPLPGWKCG
jgi:hypothetical protein